MIEPRISMALLYEAIADKIEEGRQDAMDAMGTMYPFTVARNPSLLTLDASDHVCPPENKPHTVWSYRLQQINDVLWTCVDGVYPAVSSLVLQGHFDAAKSAKAWERCEIQIAAAKWQVVLWTRAKGVDQTLMDWPECYLHIRDNKSGEEWIQTIKGNMKLDLKKRVAAWVQRWSAGEMKLAGDIMPRIDGDFYAQILTDKRPPSSGIVWQSGGFYVEEIHAN